MATLQGGRDLTLLEKRFYVTAALLGADSGLLATIGSYGDTQFEEETCEQLDAWIAGKVKDSANKELLLIAEQAGVHNVVNIFYGD